MDFLSSSDLPPVNEFILKSYPLIKRENIGLIGIISTWSMVPLLKPKMRIKFVPTNPSELKRGDIVCFTKKRFIAHRLIKKDKGKFIIKGDNNRQADNPISPKRILGKATQIIIDDKNTINLDSRKSRLVAKIFTQYSILINRLPFLLKIIKGRTLFLKAIYGKDTY